MADRFYGADIGATMPGQVTEAGSTTSKNIEVRVTYDAAGMDKQKVLNAIQAVELYIETDTWPPV